MITLSPTPPQSLEEQRPASGRRTALSLRLGMGALGLALLLSYIRHALELPAVGTVVAMVASGYAIGSLWWPRAWLLMLPAVTVAVDLVPWSGHFLFSEYDVIVVATIAALAMTGHLSRGIRNALTASSMVPIATAYAVLYLLQVESLWTFLGGAGIPAENPYYADDYSYKVGKGLLWAAFLAPAWLALYQENRVRTLSERGQTS